MSRKYGSGGLVLVLCLHVAALHVFAAGFASLVIENTPLGSPEINTVDELLGAPDGQFTAFEEVDTITPGFVTVGFGAKFFNVTGNDVFIYLYDWTQSDNEVFEVLASSDGTPGSFVSLGTSGTPNGAVQAPVILGLDLDAASLTSASYLRIENLRIHPADGEGPDIDAIQVVAPGNHGCLGSEFTVEGTSFGTKKGRISIDGIKLKVIEWKMNSIICELNNSIPPSEYDLLIQLFRQVPIVQLNTFTVEPPQIYLIDPNQGSTFDTIAIKGMYFGTKKGKVYISPEVGGSSNKKSCKVLAWQMDSRTGESSIIFQVPKKVVIGNSLIMVSNSIGQDTIGFRISP